MDLPSLDIGMWGRKKHRWLPEVQGHRRESAGAKGRLGFSGVLG